MTTSEELKAKIIDNITIILYDLSNPNSKDTNQFIINGNQFIQFKSKLKELIRLLEKNSEYTINYCLIPTKQTPDQIYTIDINILENIELVENFHIPFSIKVTYRNHFYYCDIENLIIKDFLEDNGYSDELPYFVQQLANFETEYMLIGQWLYFTTDYKQSQKKYYETLTDNEKLIFAKSHGYTSALNIIHEPFSNLFDYYDINDINNFFNQITIKY